MRRRTRFPVYAPEALEGRLNPSVAVPSLSSCEAASIRPVAAIGEATVAATDADGPTRPPVPPRGGTDPAPPDGSGDPPIEGPNIPIGPAGPA